MSEQQMPAKGEKYYILQNWAANKEWKVFQARWDNSFIDRQRFEKGNFYFTKNLANEALRERNKADQ